LNVFSLITQFQDDLLNVAELDAIVCLSRADIAIPLPEMDGPPQPRESLGQANDHGLKKCSTPFSGQSFGTLLQLWEVLIMYQVTKLTILLISGTAWTIAFAAPTHVQFETGSANGHEAVPPMTKVSIPPNQRFRNLDEYLAHLQRGAAVDKAWYRRIGPDLYRLETGNYRPLGGDDQKRIFTRAELAKKFGFAE
jgi:hypothetical protein